MIPAKLSHFDRISNGNEAITGRNLLYVLADRQSPLRERTRWDVYSILYL